MMEDKITVVNHTFKVTELIVQARESMTRAYAPYSRFKVGAVVMDGEGHLYSGANIENASYGLTCCAERCALYAAVWGGKLPVLALCVIGDTPEPIKPCGGCRQVIKEFAHPKMKIILTHTHQVGKIQILTLDELLPYSFGPEHLSKG